MNLIHETDCQNAADCDCYADARRVIKDTFDNDPALFWDRLIRESDKRRVAPR